jgi:hypothetical protein
MQDADWLTDYQVVFFEESPTHKALFKKWLTDIPTQFTSTLDDFYTQFDASVVVVCLSQSGLGDNLPEVRNHILSRSPFCQTALISSRSSTTPPKNDYDAVLQRPIFEDDLQTAVKDRFKYGVYSSLLHEFYILNAKLSGVQKANGTANVDSDVVPRQIQKRLEQIIPRIKQFQTELTETDIQEILQVITRHKEYLTEPDHGVEQANTSKHRPDSCPTCNLSWGADHGNELGNGYTSIGAGVWKCSRCDNLIHELHDSNQRVL